MRIIQLNYIHQRPKEDGIYTVFAFPADPNRFPSQYRNEVWDWERSEELASVVKGWSEVPLKREDNLEVNLS